MSNVRVRFAPSPTGDPHIGNMRTWLFCYLFAKSQNGTTVLRIEDTDQERSVPGSVQRIIDSLHWIGIGFDEGPYYQSERLDHYQKYAEELVEKGAAYRCFCLTERLKQIHEEAIKNKKPPRYDGFCRILSSKEVEKKLAVNEKFVIRLKVPVNQKIDFIDEIHNKVEFNSDLIDDQILLKSDGFPTYHLAVVVDDHLMEISYVIRSDEWLSSTPKHILLYRAFGWDLPKYIHLPMVLGSDKAKLSKRHGAKSVNLYRKEGYLAEAILNFLALLGWAPGEDREIMSLAEMVKIFKLEQVNKAAPVFDQVKLNHFNGLYIRKLSAAELTDRLLEWASDDCRLKKWLADRKYFEKALTTIQERMVTLADAEEMIKFYFEEPNYTAELLIPKNANQSTTSRALSASLSSLSSLSSWTLDNLEQTLRQLAAGHQWPAGLVLWPVRVALTGLEKSPSTFEVLEALGKEKSLERIKKAVTS